MDLALRLKDRMYDYSTWNSSDIDMANSKEYCDEMIKSRPETVIKELLDLIDELDEAYDDALEHRKPMKNCVNIHEDYLFECEVNGSMLTKGELVKITDYFMACDIAEYLIENRDIERKTAIDIGYSVWEVVAQDDWTSIIDDVLEDKKQQRIEKAKEDIFSAFNVLAEETDERTAKQILELMAEKVNIERR